MSKDTFNIPDNGPLNEALRAADSFQYSPERQPGVYGLIKASEERVHGFRRTELEIQARLPEQGFFDKLKNGTRKKKTLESLIEAETYIGGQFFAQGNIEDPRIAKVVDRFWLSHKGSSALANGNHLGDWYHLRENYDAFGRKLAETTIHLETHPTHINKIVEGVPVELSIAELQVFARAVELYERNVREQLYLFDQEIFDLFEEIDHEHFVPPPSMEDRFGKEVVARVVQALRDYKQINGIEIPPTVDEMFGEKAVQQITDETRTRL